MKTLKRIIFFVAALACTRNPPIDALPQKVEAHAVEARVIATTVQKLLLPPVSTKYVAPKQDKASLAESGPWPYDPPETCTWARFNFDKGKWYLLCKPYFKDGSLCDGCVPYTQEIVPMKKRE